MAMFLTERPDSHSRGRALEGPSRTAAIQPHPLASPRHKKGLQELPQTLPPPTWMAAPHAVVGARDAVRTGWDMTLIFVLYCSPAAASNPSRGQALWLQ